MFSSTLSIFDLKQSISIIKFPHKQNSFYLSCPNQTSNKQPLPLQYTWGAANHFALWMRVGGNRYTERVWVHIGEWRESELPLLAGSFSNRSLRLFGIEIWRVVKTYGLLHRFSFVVLEAATGWRFFICNSLWSLAFFACFFGAY